MVPGAGVALLREPTLNKGTAFTEEERDALGLRGLLPPHVSTQEEQVSRVLEQLPAARTPLAKYIMLESLQDRNEALFYRVITDYPDEMTPIIYTPTVGLACQQFGHIYRRPRGIFVSRRDRGRIDQVLRNWPHREVSMIVVTYGDVILGLGDLGANGMGIPIGKLSLYTACCGIDPAGCLPVMLDVGTNNETLRRDPLYVGEREPRLTGTGLSGRVCRGVHRRHAGCVSRRRGPVRGLREPQRVPAAREVPRAHLHVQRRHSRARRRWPSPARRPAAGHRQQADCGAAFPVPRRRRGGGRHLRPAHAGDARGRPRRGRRAGCCFRHSKGLVTAGRTDLNAHKRRYAHEHPPVTNFLDAVKTLKPTAIIGVAAMPGAFTRDVVEAMAAQNERPIVFALSNRRRRPSAPPRTRTAGTAAARCSPPAACSTRSCRTGAATCRARATTDTFPGVGLGVIACHAARVTDSMFMASARMLAESVTEGDLAQGSLYPPLHSVREVSARIATAVAEVAYRYGLATI